MGPRSLILVVFQWSLVFSRTSNFRPRARLLCLGKEAAPFSTHCFQHAALSRGSSFSYQRPKSFLKSAVVKGYANGGSPERASDNPKEPLSWEEIHKAAERRGFRMKVSTFPPVLPVSFRVDAEDLRGNTIGYISGWVSPTALIGDRMEVRKYTRWASKSPSLSQGGGKINEAELGPMMAYAMGKLAQDRGLKKVEFMAIYDSELQHQKLLRYYRFIGCQKVRAVGEDLTEDIPLRLLYGGVGTLFEADVDVQMRRWAPRFRR